MSVLDFVLKPVAADATSDLLNPAKWVYDGLGIRKTAGVMVSPSSALEVSTYFAILRNIAEDLAKLPCPVFEAFGETGRKALWDHPVSRLTNERANPRMDAMTWRETTIHHALGWGKGVSEIQRTGDGQPYALWPIHPDLVAPHLEPDGSLWWVARGINGNPTVMLPDQDVFVLKGLGPDGIVGYSLAQQAAKDLGVDLARQDFSGAFYENGTHLGGILTSTKRLSKDAIARIRSEWVETYGGPAGGHKPAILEEGMEWKPLGIPLSDAQFIESERFGVITLCRWGRMPPHKVAALDRATFSNIEHQSLEYVTDTLGSWATRFEKQGQLKLLDPDVRAIFLCHVFEELLRTDYKGLVEGNARAIQSGQLTPNEARAKLNQNPHPGEEADKLLVQGAMVTLESVAGEEPEEPEPPAAPPIPPAADEEEDEGDMATDLDDDEEELEEEAQAKGPSLGLVARLLEPSIADAFSRAAARQAKAVGRARKRHDDDDLEAFAAWASSFYTGQAAFLRTALEPVVGGFQAALNLDGRDPDQVDFDELVRQVANDTTAELEGAALEAFKGGRAWEDLDVLAKGPAGPAAFLARLELNLEEAAPAAGQ